MSKPGNVIQLMPNAVFRPRTGEAPVAKATVGGSPGATQVFNDSLGRYSWTLFTTDGRKRCLLRMQPAGWTAFQSNQFLQQLLEDLNIENSGGVITITAKEDDTPPSKYATSDRSVVYDPVGDFLTILGLHMNPPRVKVRKTRALKEPARSPVPVYGDPVSASFRANPTAKLQEPKPELVITNTSNASMTFEEKLAALVSINRKHRK